jgi:hypothetical protein
MKYNLLGTSGLLVSEFCLGALEIDLTADELARMDAASALPELYPYRFLENYQRSL